MSGFPRVVTSAQIVAGGGMLRANNLSDVASVATSRTNLGLGTAAVAAASSFLAVANNLSDVNNAATALANLSGTPLNITINPQTGTTYTLALADLGKLVTLSNVGAITLTVDTAANVAFAVGAEILIAQIGAGQVTVAGAGGVTVNATPGLKLRAQYSYGCLVKRATNTWDLSGDLSA